MTTRRLQTKTQGRLAMAVLVIACACGDSATEPPPDGPDLIVSIPDAPASVAYGSTFHMEVTVLNRGTRTAGRTQVFFLHSADQTITTADAVLGSEFTDTLAVDRELQMGVRVEPPRDALGTLYYGACVDPLPDEIDTENNCSVAAGVEIFLPPPFGAVVDRTHQSLTSRIVSGGGQTSYQVYRRRSEAGDFSRVRDVSASGEETSYTDTGLEPNTVYYYKAIACKDAICSDESDEWGGLTEVVGPVDIPAVPEIRGEKVNISFGTDKARVHWDAVPRATYYRVYQDEDLDAEVSAPALSYYDDDPNTFLGAYQTTRYKVQACNKAGCSGDSETVVITIPPPG
ncbi:MAG: hypothetical protein OXH49_06480 [Gemmatimonadetes bacterium]|nr:hypothetical protein [Gemmatimonadota bacterium]